MIRHKRVKKIKPVFPTLKYWVITLVVLCSLDALLTAGSMQFLGFIETNPLMAALIELHMGAFLAVKALSCILFAAIFTRAPNERAYLTLRFCTLFMGGVVLWNIGGILCHLTGLI